jgi:ABC-type multidrug transport system fused ATPase/permease subunit
MRLQWENCRLSFVFLIILIPINIGCSYCGIFLARTAVYAVVENFPLIKIISSIGVLCIALAILNSASQLIDTYNFALLTRFRESIIYMKTKKILNTDYQNLESSKCRLLMQRADESLWSSGQGSPVERMAKGFSKLVTNILAYILFGTMLSFASPFIVFILTVVPAANFLVVKMIQKYQYAKKDETAKLDKKLWYIANKAGDFNSAKDIRIYTMKTWFIDIYRKISKERLDWDKKFSLKYFLSMALNLTAILLRDGLVYIILISLFLKNSITIYDFVMYFAAIAGFSIWVEGIINEFIAINSINLLVCDLRDFLTYPEKNNRKQGCKLPNTQQGCSIELKDVCYAYEGLDRNIINHINIVIESGEKIAIVGMNGAGKTTLIKLICGLYLPISGAIYINGKNANEYNIHEYYSLFSTVFQDHNFLPIPLVRVVSGKKTGEEDPARINTCIELAGLKDKTDALPNGLNTPLNKQLNSNAIELSGGEEQKLLLARALYKEAPILILDEPTAALDPIAESRLYRQYETMCVNKTAIFISHRLASTQFCDRILFMKDGEIKETGSHRRLLQYGGEYASLYETQSQYYTEDIEGILI